MPSKQHRPNHQRWWHWLLRDLAMLSCLAAAGELAVRLWLPAFQTQVFDHDLTGGFPMDLNADYYRGPQLPRQKASGEQRVLALGDSTTYGTGVASSQTFIADLGPLLQSRLGHAVSVINSGIEGASIRDLRHAYEDKWLDYGPDSVIVAISPNMVSMALIQAPDEVLTVKSRYVDPNANLTLAARAKQQLGRFVHQLGLVSFLSRGSQMLFYWLGPMNHNLDPKRPYGTLLAYGYRQGDLPPELAAKGWEVFTEDLRQLVERVKADHRHLVLTLIEPRFQLSDQISDNLKHVPTERFSTAPLERIRAIAAALDVPFVDATAALRQAAELARRDDRPHDLYLLLDFAHLSAKGHAKLAEALAPVVL